MKVVRTGGGGTPLYKPYRYARPKGRVWGHFWSENTLLILVWIRVASHADVFRGSSRVPGPRTSADLSGKKRRPITADFQIWEVHFGP